MPRLPAHQRPARSECGSTQITATGNCPTRQWLLFPPGLRNFRQFLFRLAFQLGRGNQELVEIRLGGGCVVRHQPGDGRTVAGDDDLPELIRGLDVVAPDKVVILLDGAPDHAADHQQFLGIAQTFDDFLGGIPCPVVQLVGHG